MSSFKDPITDFIRRVINMMEKYPETISWSQQGGQLVIYNERYLRQNVLPQFFRHNRTGSFIRQLNIYGFHKICWNKSFINFRHQHFRRDNERNFHLIQRKKKENAQVKAKVKNFEEFVKEEIKQQYSRTISSLPVVTQQLLNYKNKATKELRQLKKQIDLLGREINQRRSKKVKPLIASIKEIISCTEEKTSQLEMQITESFRKQGQPQNQYSNQTSNQPSEKNTIQSREMAMEQEIERELERQRNQLQPPQLNQFGSISNFIF